MIKTAQDDFIQIPLPCCLSLISRSALQPCDSALHSFVCAVMAPFSSFFSLSLFLSVRAETNSTCQSSIPNTVFFDRPFKEASCLCAERIGVSSISAVQLTLFHSQTAIYYSFDSQRLQSTVSQHVLDQCLKLLVYNTFWPDSRLQHIWASLSDWFHYSWSESYHRNHNYCTTMLVIS